MMENHTRQRSPLGDCAVAAPEAGAERRPPQTSASAGGGRTDASDRAIARIEAASGRIQDDDLSALDAVLADRVPALDKARSQSRASLTSLLAFVRPCSAARPRRGAKNSRNSSEQTIGGGNCAA